MNPNPEVRRLWWLHPAWPFAMLIGVTIVAAYFQGQNAYWLYRTPKYVELWHVWLGFAIIAAFSVGTWLGTSTGKVPQPAPDEVDHNLRRWFYGTMFLTLFGYIAWLLLGIARGFRPHHMVELLTGNGFDSDWVRDTYFPTMPGVTTCTQFGVVAVLLGLWVYFRGDKSVLWPLITLVIAATMRALLFNERTALIEMFVPAMVLVLRMKFLGRVWPAWCRKAMLAAPFLAPLILLVFFGSFEYFRSWRFYQHEFDSYPSFVAWRLTGYYTTAHNNGAMALETHQYRPLPYYTLVPLWLFPGVRESPWGYEKLTGIDMPTAHKKMLKTYGNDELNNEGGMFQPTLDYGVAGSLIFWLLYGFIAGRLYRSYQVGTVGGLTLYPLFFLSILEIPLILFICYSRMFPALVVLSYLAWKSSRPTTSLNYSQPALRPALETV